MFELLKIIEEIKSRTRCSLGRLTVILISKDFFFMVKTT